MSNVSGVVYCRPTSVPTNVSLIAQYERHFLFDSVIINWNVCNHTGWFDPSHSIRFEPPRKVVLELLHHYRYKETSNFCVNWNKKKILKFRKRKWNEEPRLRKNVRREFESRFFSERNSFGFQISNYLILITTIQTEQLMNFHFSWSAAGQRVNSSITFVGLFMLTDKIIILETLKLNQSSFRIKRTFKMIFLIDEIIRSTTHQAREVK